MCRTQVQVTEFKERSSGKGKDYIQVAAGDWPSCTAPDNDAVAISLTILHGCMFNVSC
jgi:hypothetical protein